VLDWPFSTTSTTSNLPGDENEFGFVHLPLLLLIDQAQWPNSLRKSLLSPGCFVLISIAEIAT
jgi:hypothetical protein